MKKVFALSLLTVVPSLTFAQQQIKINPYLEIRPRYEHVEDKNNNLKSADALTVRTVLGLRAKKIFIENLKGCIEATDVSGILRNYSPESSKYDLVPDPDNTRITQAYLTYTINKTTFIVGRKFITIDDHRFIGNVGWRQMPQSFGVLAIADKTLPNTDILVAAIYERLGILDKLNTKWHLDKAPLIFDINYQPVKWLKIKPFAYLITDVHNTYGLKLSGTRKYDSFSISYVATYAKQTDPYQKDNLSVKPKIDTDYWRLGLNSNIKGFLLGAEYTHFGDKNGKSKGFSTPLATLHKFDGWSDALLKGAANGFDYGLNEYKLSAGYTHKQIGKFLISYFIFNSAKSQPSGKKVGTEVDVAYIKKLNKYISFLAKAAFYNAKDGYYSNGNLIAKKDINKYWLQIDYKF